LVEDSEGRAWAATTHGLVRLSGGDMELVPWEDGGVKAVFSLQSDPYGGVVASVGNMTDQRDKYGFCIVTSNSTVSYRNGVMTKLDLPDNFLAVDKNNLYWYSDEFGYAAYDVRPDVWDGPRSGIALRQSYPNPFNAAATIEFDLYSWSRVDLAVYNILGQKIRTLVHDRLPAGTHRIVWDTRDDSGAQVSAGRYFYRLSRGDQAETGRMMFVK
jgi:hypothetical protein